MTAPVTRARSPWRLGPGVFVARPNLTVSALVGLAVGVGVALLVDRVRLSSCLIAGWDTFCLLYLGLIWRALTRKGPDDIRARAAEEDQGQAVLLLVIVGACVASVVAVALELSLAQGGRGLSKALHVAAGVATLAVSWWLMQVVFALHYAHAYYARDPETGTDIGGLDFPGKGPPDYWGFLHFAVVIGVAAQTADVAFTDRRLRRLGTGHSLIAFAFNTLIVALAINLVAGLF